MRACLLPAAVDELSLEASCGQLEVSILTGDLDEAASQLTFLEVCTRVCVCMWSSAARMSALCPRGPWSAAALVPSCAWGTPGVRAEASASDA